MSPVHRLSQMGSMTTNKIDYPSMLAGYGDFGALQRIAYATASGSSNVFTFNSISQNFQDLRLVMFYSSTDANTKGLNFYPNGGAASEKSQTGLQGDGSSASSYRASNTIGWYNYNPNSSSSVNVGTNIFVATTWDILNYANTSTFKTCLVRTAADNNGSGTTHLVVNLLRNTAAITSIQVYTAFGNYVAGSTAALYGVRASAS